MARKRKKAQQPDERPVIRSTLHMILAGRKAARHRPEREKRAAQKLRRELEQD